MPAREEDVGFPMAEVEVEVDMGTWHTTCSRNGHGWKHALAFSTLQRLSLREDLSLGRGGLGSGSGSGSEI